MADEGLIKQVLDEVKDPALRDKLLNALAEEPTRAPQEPNAMNAYIRLQVGGAKLISPLFFVGGAVGLLNFWDDPDYIYRVLFGGWMVLSAAVFVGAFMFFPSQHQDRHQDEAEER